MRTAFKGLLDVWPYRLWLALRFGSEDLEVAHLPTLEECTANEWQLTPDARDPSMLRRMAALGGNPPHSLIARVVAGLRRLAAIRGNEIERQGSTLS